MTKNETTKPPTRGNVRTSAGVDLEGKTLTDFKTIKDKIETAMPGVKTTNSDVLRHALHLAASQSATSKQRKAQNASSSSNS